MCHFYKKIQKMNIPKDNDYALVAAAITYITCNLLDYLFSVTTSDSKSIDVAIIVFITVRIVLSSISIIKFYKS